LLRNHATLDRVPGPPPRGRLAPWQIRRATDYLRANLAREVTLGELAALVGLSPYHFARAFKASAGLPPNAYHRLLRVERAKELLVRTDLDVTAVAAAVGYASPSAFARMFRAAAGCHATAFRRAARH